MGEETRTAQSALRTEGPTAESPAPGIRVEVASSGPVYDLPSHARHSIGSAPTNDIVITDPSVSRFHCELIVDSHGVRIRDCTSRNGTWVEGIRVEAAWLRDGMRVQVGDRQLTVRMLAHAPLSIPASERRSFGRLVGGSLAMRQVYALLERYAPRNSTVLVTGETGTGKELVAEALHEASSRAEAPFVVVDCSTLPSTLLESELFGHEKGAFTGAVEARQGAFAFAHGGTVFLDEIGELPVALQPKLLRVLEARTVRPLGGGKAQKVDVRVVAATNRDLRGAVNEGTFRADLFYRLAVLQVSLPALRMRVDDLPALVPDLLRQLGAAEEEVEAFSRGPVLRTLANAAWPGNVRELRNYLERCLAIGSAQPIGEVGEVPPRTYAEGKRRTLERFERAYLLDLLERVDHNVSEAARVAEISRASLYRMMARHGLMTRSP